MRRVVFVSTLVLIWTTAWAQQYRITELERFFAHDLNDRGEVTGDFIEEIPPACVCDEFACSEEDICFPPRLPAYRRANGWVHVLSNSAGVGTALSDSGTIVVSNYATRDLYHWSAEGGIQPMLGGGDGQTTVSRSSADGQQVFGTLETPSFGMCPARWPSMTAWPVCVIPSNGDEFGWVADVNAAGVLVGGHGGRPFRAAPGQAPEVFDLPGQAFMAIENDGTILGVDGTLYFPDGRQHRIEGLPGCDGRVAIDMNSSLQVIGVSVCDEGHRAWVWSPSTGTVDLATAAGAAQPMEWVRRINEEGQIIVDGATLTAGNFPVLRSLLLTPVEEPPARDLRR
jgi:hypothetical protein